MSCGFYPCVSVHQHNGLSLHLKFACECGASTDITTSSITVSGIFNCQSCRRMWQLPDRYNPPQNDKNGQDTANKLGSLRKCLGIETSEVASRMNLDPGQVSAIEDRDLERVSIRDTMNYIHAIGGKFELTVKLGNQTMILPI